MADSLLDSPLMLVWPRQVYPTFRDTFLHVPTELGFSLDHILAVGTADKTYGAWRFTRTSVQLPDSMRYFGSTAMGAVPEETLLEIMASLSEEQARNPLEAILEVRSFCLALETFSTTLIEEVNVWRHAACDEALRAAGAARLEALGRQLGFFTKLTDSETSHRG